MDEEVSWMNETVEKKIIPETESTSSKSRDPKTVKLRETNKRLRTIYEESGLAYGKDADESGLHERLHVALILRKRSVKAVFDSIRKARNVELCFLVDVTGSMQPHIDGVQNSITKIVDSLTSASLMPQEQQKTAKQLRLAFVAYRDHSDTKQFEVLQFTESVETFQTFCAGLKADGGKDVPEDVFGGIEKALELPWSSNFGTKVIFHIADAPCHGKKYHDLNDDYPSGDPKSRTEIDLFKEMLEKDVDYYFGKINNTTDKMIKLFSRAYNQEITEFDIKNVTAITETVVSAVSCSVLISLKESRVAGLPKATRPYTIIKDVPNWSRIPKREGRYLYYEMPESFDDIINDIPLKRQPPVFAKIQIAENPFAHGTERYAFYGRDVTTGSQIVLKEYIHVGPGMNTAARYEITNQIQTVAFYFAQEFSKKIVTCCSKQCIIKFLKTKTLCLQMNKNESRFLSCEKQYNKRREFVRFTNNTNYVISEKVAQDKGIDVDFVKLLVAFSHWTYKISKKQLMVVDLQGIINNQSEGTTIITLTDPAIHCTDKTRFGRMNLGAEGMEKFFSNHQCNNFCKALVSGSFLSFKNIFKRNTIS